MSVRFEVGNVVELDRDCELGNRHERAVVMTIDDSGRFMRILFPFRSAQSDRNVCTGLDYLYLRKV